MREMWYNENVKLWKNGGISEMEYFVNIPKIKYEGKDISCNAKIESKIDSLRQIERFSMSDIKQV